MYLKFFKRLIDIILSGIGLLVLALPMLVVAIIIKCEDPGPVIFKHNVPAEAIASQNMRVCTADA